MLVDVIEIQENKSCWIYINLNSRWNDENVPLRCCFTLPSILNVRLTFQVVSYQVAAYKIYIVVKDLNNIDWNCASRQLMATLKVLFFWNVASFCRQKTGIDTKEK